MVRYDLRAAICAGCRLAALLPACSKTKLYRFDQDSGEWKERGIGAAKLLQHKENKKIRMLMRQEKTLKIRANHLGAASGQSACRVAQRRMGISEWAGLHSDAWASASGQSACRDAYRHMGMLTLNPYFQQNHAQDL